MSKRYAPAQVPQPVDHAVPLFLEQLTHTLEAEKSTTLRVVIAPFRNHAEVAAIDELNGLYQGFFVPQAEFCAVDD